MPIIKCAVCGKDVDCKPSRLEKTKRGVTCSRECASILRKSLTELNCTCYVCGKKFHDKRCHAEQCKRHYCSRECKGIDFQTRYAGDNNPNAFCRVEMGNRRKHCGYWWVFVPDHPFAVDGGYVREHRLVAEKYLLTDENSIEIDGKKYLAPDYDVHHIDRNKLNNSPDNLMVLTRSEHSHLHQMERH